ncbi:MAG: ribulose-phosphate 3-epimerase [Deltaproteobacteria bacterium]|nr:ribulose-phosphate 3-epimerase [Deltaproteobacteria bacterium]
MDKKYKIAPSILSADFSRLGEEIKATEKAGVDLFHIDVMDGHFVPNITMGPIMVEAARKVTKLPLDTHLMIENPEKYIEAFIKAGSTGISVHIETCKNLPETLHMIHNFGAKPGIAINPDTPIEKLTPFLEKTQYILVMSVHPGFGGQKFIESTYEKIKKLAHLIKKSKQKIDIAIDGGVGLDNIKKLKDAGVNIFVAGSAIFKSRDYAETIQKMRGAL